MESRKRKALFPCAGAEFLWKRWQNKSPSVLVANLSWGNLDVRSFRQESQVERREGEATIRLQCRQRSSSSVCGTFLDRLPKLHQGRRD